MLILASRSPQRKAILEQLGVEWNLGGSVRRLLAALDLRP